MEKETDGNREPWRGRSTTLKRRNDNLGQDTQNFTPLAKQRFRPESVSSRVTDWLEQIPTVDPATATPFPGREIMANVSGRPKTPSSRCMPKSVSFAAQSVAETTTSSKTRLVGKGEYRRTNMELVNNLCFRIPSRGPDLPDSISDACQSIDSFLDPPISLIKQMRINWEELGEMQEGGDSAEVDIEKWFQENVFPLNPKALGLRAHQRLPFARACALGVNHPTHPVSLPVPDTAYGYTLKETTSHFKRAKRNLNDQMILKIGEASPHDIFFPFVIIEYKSDSGSRAVAVNQCLGGSATCVAIMDRLNTLLEKYPGAKKVCNAAFSFVIDLHQAELFVSWMDDNEEDEAEVEDDEDEDDKEDGVDQDDKDYGGDDDDGKEDGEDSDDDYKDEDEDDDEEEEKEGSKGYPKLGQRKEDMKRALVEAKARRRSGYS
ncbi:hypothetical protein PG988_001129 [Apiospora saccharicola]